MFTSVLPNREYMTNEKLSTDARIKHLTEHDQGTRRAASLDGVVPIVDKIRRLAFAWSPIRGVHLHSDKVTADEFA